MNVHHPFSTENHLMARIEPPRDYEAVVEHFRNLPLDQQETALKSCRDILTENAQKEHDALTARLAELNAVMGRPDAAPHGRQAEEGRTRSPASIKYYHPESGEHSTGRGSWKNAPWVKTILEAGGDIEKFRVGPDNPLPEHLK